ncbi:MAG: alpha/beta hydrolase [Tessaracoccus sp.]|nr:alpha/beta hydrolase [Tessaracoccus sp.]
MWPKQLAGYVADLTHYFVELDLAVEQLRAEGHDRIVFMGHSTGGLVGSLHANARPGTFAAVILHSPWLELQGNSVLRPATQPVFTAMRAVAPTSSLPASEIGHYRRSIAADQDGEWVYNHNLKGTPRFCCASAGSPRSSRATPSSPRGSTSTAPFSSVSRSAATSAASGTRRSRRPTPSSTSSGSSRAPTAWAG